jgi:glycosyltransferase involved in cell wall biosynthesis
VQLRVLSGKDARLAAAMGVRTPTDVIPPILVGPAVPAPAGRPGVVACIGALWRPENVDGLLWFAREVWPEVRRQRPAEELVLTGANPPAELTALDGAHGIVVEGFRADLRPAFDRAGVFVVPLRQGAGIKVKVLEAMLHRLPVVTTQVGAEGIHDEAPPGAMLVAADGLGMAAMIVDLLEHAERRAAMAEAAWRWASVQFAQARVEGRVRELYADGGRLSAQARSS